MSKAKAFTSAGIGRRLSCVVIAGMLQILSAHAAEEPEITLQGSESAKRDGPIGTSPFYESHQVKTCNNANFCLLPLAVVPSGRRLEATNLNCLVNVQTNQDLVRLVLYQGPFTAPLVKNDFVLIAVNPESSIPLFALNESIRTFIEGGTRPLLAVAPGSTVPQISVQCALSGNLRAS